MSEVPSRSLRAALAQGGAAVAAWAEVLDRINVFPVADGDTGRNLVLSLAPLRDAHAQEEALLERLLLSARGNSGNIGCAFVRALLDAKAGASLGERCVAGAARAREAVAHPQPGTMLTVLDTLAEETQAGLDASRVPEILQHLTRVVHLTRSAQASLRQAGVVDSGALGMLVFLEGALRSFFALADEDRLAASFGALARFDCRAAALPAQAGVCIDAVVRLPVGATPPLAHLARLGTDVVVVRAGQLWKVHLHADDTGAAHSALTRMGEIVAWSWDDFQEQARDSPWVASEGEAHVVTDGAASLSRRQADELGVTLLDSQIDLGDRSLPETQLDPDDLYRLMRRGMRVSTAQASTHERHLHYQRLRAQWQQILYLCVGSAYTGNYAVAEAWCARHDPDGRVRVLDSGAASGRLAVVVRATALRARQGEDAVALAAFASAALARAEEYIFVECLDYLARSGRLSKTGARLGNALGLAPVVSPAPDGARRVALLRNPEARVNFACAKVERAFATMPRGHLLVEHTDNRAFVAGEVMPRLRAAAPQADIELGALSLTTGVHTGPGTWGVAFLPEQG